MNRRDALKRTAAITGMAVTASAGIGLLNGCEPTGAPDWKPKFLSRDQVKLVSAIAEMILPKTDTPGAIDLNVPEFIDLMLADNYKEQDQEAVRHGLNTFEEEILAEYEYYFYECSQPAKKEIMKTEEERAWKHYTDTGSRNFYLIIKELTVLGYYSSEYVMQNMLNYRPVAGRYEACIPLKPEDKVYVDNNTRF